jgi:hypothetical protein
VSFRIRFRRWAPMAFLLLTPGCSGEESFALPLPSFVRPSTRYENACKAWAESNCTYQALCHTAANFPWDNFAQCITRNTLGCELRADDPGISFDEERIRTCAFPDRCSIAPSDCWGQGSTPAGRPCLWGEACHSGFCAKELSLGLCGLCVCDILCPPGQGCVITSAGTKCAALKLAAGQPCSSSEDCQSTTCASSADGSQVCSPLGKLGDLCGEGMAACGDELACDPMTHRCNTTALVGFGASCIKDGGPILGCNGFATCLDGTCVPPLDDGALCDQGPACAWPAECIDNHCVFPTVADCSL